MHRPGLSELEPLMKHADALPVEDVDGQAYLRYSGTPTQYRVGNAGDAQHTLFLVSKAYHSCDAGRQQAYPLKWNSL